MLIIDGNLVFPDSPEWKNLLCSQANINFYGADSEVEFGFIEHQDEDFLFNLHGGLHKVIVKRDYINWFVFRYYWFAYAELSIPDWDLFKNIRPHLYRPNVFQGFLGMNTDFYDKKIYKKIMKDFKEVNPKADIFYTHPQTNEEITKFRPSRFPMNKYRVISELPYTVKSDAVLDYCSCFRLDALLHSFSTGCSYPNDFFAEHYLNKNNMFIDQ